jgi:hypothetical protein
MEAGNGSWEWIGGTRKLGIDRYDREAGNKKTGQGSWEYMFSALL